MFSLIRIASFWRSCSCRDKQAPILLCWSLWEPGVIDKGLWLGQTRAPRYGNWCMHFSQSSLCSTEAGGGFLLSTCTDRWRKLFPACLCRQGMQRQPMKLVPDFCWCPWGGLSPTLLGPSLVAAAGKLCRRLGVSGVCWGVHCLRDRRSRTNSLNSKIAEKQRWAGHAVGTPHAQKSLDVSVCNLLAPAALWWGNILLSSSNVTADLEAQGPHQPGDPAACLLPPPSAPQLLWDGLLYLPFSSGKMERHNWGKLWGFEGAELRHFAYWALEASHWGWRVAWFAWGAEGGWCPFLLSCCRSPVEPSPLLSSFPLFPLFIL